LNTEKRHKERRQYLCLGQPEEPAVTEHTRYDTEFNNAYRLDKATSYMDSLVKEAIGI
jgi:hypothetical protein